MQVSPEHEPAHPRPANPHWRSEHRKVDEPCPRRWDRAAGVTPLRPSRSAGAHRWKYRRRAAGEGGGGGGDTMPARPWLGRPRATSDVGLRRLPRATKDGVKTAYISLSTCKEYVSSAAPCGPQSRSYMPPAGTRHQHMCASVGCPSAALGSRFVRQPSPPPLKSAT